MIEDLVAAVTAGLLASAVYGLRERAQSRFPASKQMLRRGLTVHETYGGRDGRVHVIDFEGALALTIASRSI